MCDATVSDVHVNKIRHVVKGVIHYTIFLNLSEISAIQMPARLGGPKQWLVHERCEVVNRARRIVLRSKALR